MGAWLVPHPVSVAVCLPAISGPGPIAAIAGFLVMVSAYWVVAALALLFFASRRRSGLVESLIIATIAWLLLRGLGALLRLLVPCIAVDAESAFGFIVAVALSYLLPLRLWQRVLCLSIVALAAATLAYTLRCQVPSEIILAALALALGATLLWLLGRSPGARQIWQRVALPIDNWFARHARTPLTPTLQTVLAARLQQQLRFTIEEMQPLDALGVHASTPVVLAGHDAYGREQRYFVKIVSVQNWVNSVVYETLHWLLNRGRMRTGPLWPSLKALVEYEHYMLLLFTDLRVPVPRPRGIFRLQRQVYALVSDYLSEGQMLREAGPVSARFVRRTLLALQRMREADCAHHDIKASNIMILPGDNMVLVDLALAVYVAGARRLARDLADMLVVLAMHHPPEAVVAIALEVIGAEGLRHAKAYLHRSHLNTETQKMLPMGLPRELRGLIDAATAQPTSRRGRG